MHKLTPKDKASIENRCCREGVSSKLYRLRFIAYDAMGGWVEEQVRGVFNRERALAMDKAKSINRGYRVGNNTRRLVYSLVLIPIVPAAAIIGVTMTQDLLVSSFMDEVRGFNLFSAIIWVTAIIAIWRKAIIWTLGRKWLTALVGFIPFVQIVYGHALWNSGCMQSELRLSQFQVGVGVWIWVIVWVWWIWERRNMKKHSENEATNARRLPENVLRIVASLGLIPAMVGVFFIAGTAFDELLNLSSSLSFVGAYILVALLTLVIWMLIWRGAVVWSAKVLLKTILLAMVMMVVPSLGILLTSSANPILDILTHVTPIIGWGLWMASTVRYWPMKVSAGGDGLTPKCLQCGYLLTGLRGTRCPECGDEPTLDELWAATAAGGL